MVEAQQTTLQFEDVGSDSLFQPAADEARFWEPDKYVFVTRSIRRVKNTNPKYTGAQNFWTFDVYNADGTFVKRLEDGTPAQFSQFISDKMTPQSRGRPLIEAILGRKLGVDEQLDASLIFGKPFVGFIQYEVPANSETGKQKPYLRSPMTWPKGRAWTPEEADEVPVASTVDDDELPF